MKNKLGVKAALLLVGTNGVVSAAMITPVLAYIAQSFPGDSTKVSLLVTLPTLVTIPFILLTGKIAEYVGKKTLCIVGTVLFILGGVAAGFTDSLNIMLLWRAVMGVGGGILFTVPNALVADLFEGQERATVMGHMSTCQSVLQIAAGMFAGFVGIINWKYCFYGYAFYIICLILEVITLPDLPPEKAEKGSAEKSTGNEKLGGKIWLFALLVFGIFASGSVYNLNISMLVIDGGFGTSVDAGVVTTVTCISTIVFTLLFGWMFKRLKMWILVICVACEAIGFALGIFAQNIMMVYVSAVFFGMLTICVPYFMTRSSMVVPPSKRTMGMSVIGVAIFLGQFASTPLLALLESILGEGYRNMFWGALVISVILLVIVVLYVIANQKKELRSWDELLEASAPPEP